MAATGGLVGRRSEVQAPVARIASTLLGAASVALGYNQIKMTHQLDATYEQDGVLRLAHPLPLADQQHVQVTVTDSQVRRGKWAALDMKTREILLYAESVKEARDQGRTMGRGEPLIRWISSEPELPSAGL